MLETNYYLQFSILQILIYFSTWIVRRSFFVHSEPTTPVCEFMECAHLITIGIVPFATGGSINKVVFVKEAKSETETW